MLISQMRKLFLASSVVGMSALAACDQPPKKWETPNMTAMTPRVETIFEKTRTVCFGRFLIDVPATATVVWGNALVPYDLTVYPNGVNAVEEMSQKFIDGLNKEKAINHNYVPLLLAVESVAKPEGKLVVGYEDYQSINGLKINGYFKLNNDGVVINSRPMREDKDQAIEDIKNLARRLRRRTEDEVPLAAGNCIEHAFVEDKPNPVPDDLLEHIRIGFRLKEFPDAHLSIYVAPANPYDTKRDSLEAQWKRIVDEASPEERKALASTKFFRKSPRQIHDWQTGYEVLTRSPDEEGSLSHHDFQVKFSGVSHDVLRPYADIQFYTGVADDAAGAVKASLTDEEAIAVWDKITSSIRVRPTRDTSRNSAGAGPQPHSPLGALAVTGRICPQTGWWEPDDASDKGPNRRQLLKAGERMPYLMVTGEPSLWQKLKGERPIHHNATTWKLVAYDDDPGHNKPAADTARMSQPSPETAIPKEAYGGTVASSQDATSSPKKG